MILPLKFIENYFAIKCTGKDFTIKMHWKLFTIKLRRKLFYCKNALGIILLLKFTEIGFTIKMH